jgi:hypothetical protein
MLHPIDQNNYQVPGCPETFLCAADLVFHPEDGQCQVIKSSEFKSYLQHKGIVNSILRDPILLQEIQNKDYYDYLDASRTT